MCGIFAVLDVSEAADGVRQRALAGARALRHRGPDWSGIWQDEHAVLAHERLAIVDVEGGAQPIISADGRYVLCVNGEIYNHRELRQEYRDYPFQTGSDCEVIIPLWLKDGAVGLEKLSGMFAFVLYDSHRHHYFIARDRVGIIPLYWGRDEHGQRLVASEMKALVEDCSELELFTPGQFYDSRTGLSAYFAATTTDVNGAEFNPPAQLCSRLRQSVHQHLMGDVPYGVLLSGGLDSSIIAAMAAQFAANRIEENDAAPAWWPQLHTFSIGLAGAPDLVAARQVAEHIGSVQHEFHFTIDEGIDALADVIRHLETYDVTTIRASVPMYLLARKIRAMGVKMVLSGEGADEIFGGYLYFHKAPNVAEFDAETRRKLHRLHQYDCLRANKATAAWGVETRVPFLNNQFIDYAMALDPALKMCAKGRIEKHILREACADLLPDAIVWRQKEQFSDGVGYAWIDGLRDHAERVVSTAELSAAAQRYPVNTPPTKEALLYRKRFEETYHSAAAIATVPGGPSVACSTAEVLHWDERFRKNIDPSGRSVTGIHGR